MKKVRNWGLALLLALFAVPAFAQPFDVRITMNDTMALPDTVTLGSQYNFQVFLHNDSAFTFTDSLTLFYRIDTVNYISPSGSSGLEYSIIVADSIPANDSILVNITAHVTSPAFKVGPSVVVIWPVAPHHNLLFDTLSKQIYVRDLGNDLQEPGQASLKMLVNGNILRFVQEADLPLKYVRIYDATGQLILQENAPSLEVQLPPLPAGIYFTEVYWNNRRHLFRFAKP